MSGTYTAQSNKMSDSSIVGLLRSAIKAIIPYDLRSRIRRFWRRAAPKRIFWGSLRRTTPFSRKFGYDRGGPVDRYYIGKFLECYKDDIRGHVLEIAVDTYTRIYGGDRVTESDILHVVTGNPKATIVADLQHADCIPENTFDCIILTQTLLFIWDVRSALRNVSRILKPNGVVLTTFPGISQIARGDMDQWGDYWRFTDLSAKLLFEESFGEKQVEVKAFGNVLTATAMLYGISSTELHRRELDFYDADYQVLIGVRAVKRSP